MLLDHTKLLPQLYSRSPDKAGRYRPGELWQDENPLPNKKGAWEILVTEYL